MLLNFLLPLGLYFACFFGYQYYYFRVSYGGAKKTRETVNNELRKNWLTLAIDREEPIIVIQTIRNLIMTGTFLISLNMLLLGGIGSLISSNEMYLDSLTLIRDMDVLELLNKMGDHFNIFKVFISIFMLLYSAFNFTGMIRILYNMNFSIPAAIYDKSDVHFQMEQIKRQSKHFNKGIRALLYSVGPILWLVNTPIFVIFALTITVTFYKFDSNTKRK
ncbi:MAG: DUF599 domain-containing protein [Leptospirales bacterium]